MFSSVALETFNGGKCEKVKWVALVSVKDIRRTEFASERENRAKENEESVGANEARDAGDDEGHMGSESSDIV